MNICCVSVTYGNRAHLLEQVVDAAREQDIRRFIIVDNGSDPPGRERLEKIKSKHGDLVHIVSLTENTGSAKGFKTGIEEALKFDECDFIYLLDDDNRPESSALGALAAKWKNTPLGDKESKLALCSFRKDRVQFVRLANGEDVWRCFDIKNSVLGFHLFSLFSRIIRRLGVASRRSGDPMLEEVALPYAPYGGLFFHKDLIHGIGLPNEDFFLYHDDSEFTLRITRSGGSIHLVTSSRIEDIDRAWNEVARKKLFNISYIHDGDDMKVYYSVRNKVYLYYTFLMDNKILWSLNKTLCLSVLWTVASMYGRNARYGLVRRAINDGIAGRLGKLDIPLT